MSGVEDSERCGRRTYAEGSGHDRKQGKGGGSAQGARAVANVLSEMFEPVPAPGNVAFFTQESFIAESAACGGSSVIFGHA